MNEKACQVTVVVDPEFGSRLRDIPSCEPSWVVDSVTNHPVIQEIWRERKAEYPCGMTSFKFDSKESPEGWLISELDTIDLHHGEYSQETPWTVLNVIGAKWTDSIGRALSRLGFRRDQETSEGFTAIRGTANNTSEGICR